MININGVDVEIVIGPSVRNIDGSLELPVFAFLPEGPDDDGGEPLPVPNAA